MAGRVCICGSREYLGNLQLCCETNFFLKKKVLNYNKDVKQEGKRRIVHDECHGKSGKKKCSEYTQVTCSEARVTQLCFV